MTMNGNELFRDFGLEERVWGNMSLQLADQGGVVE